MVFYRNISCCSATSTTDGLSLQLPIHMSFMFISMVLQIKAILVHIYLVKQRNANKNPLFLYHLQIFAIQTPLFTILSQLNNATVPKTLVYTTGTATTFSNIALNTADETCDYKA